LPVSICAVAIAGSPALSAALTGPPRRADYFAFFPHECGKIGLMARRKGDNLPEVAQDCHFYFPPRIPLWRLLEGRGFCRGGAVGFM
jgi:hypothetical protein